MLSGARRAESKHLTMSTAHLVRSLDGARDDRAKESNKTLPVMLSGARRAKSKHLTTSTAHLVRPLD